MPVVSEFAIPLSREDLLKSLSDDSQLMSPQGIVNQLTECQNKFVEIGPSHINECFNVFPSIMQHFRTVSGVIKASFWNLIVEALTDVDQLLDCAMFNNITKRNSLKMLIYVIAQFVELYENEESKPSSVNAVQKSGKSKRTNAVNSGSGSMWEAQRTHILTVLYEVLQHDLRGIFEPPTYDGLEDTVSLVSGCCFKLLENPLCAKDVEFKDAVANLLGLIVQSYHQNLGVSVKIVQLLQHFDHLVQPLAFVVHVMATKYNLDTFIGDIIREIGEKDDQDLSLDTSGTKSYSAFIYETAHLLPVQAKNSVQFLLPHLNGESPTLRCGILSAFGEILQHTLHECELDEENRKLRHTLFTLLQDHVLDTSAFVRSKVLQVWLHLCETKSVPLSQLKDLLKIISDRLNDKSSLVRKSAMQLIVCLLKSNPFSDNLDLKHFKQLLLEEGEKLKRMLPQEYLEKGADNVDDGNGDEAMDTDDNDPEDMETEEMMDTEGQAPTATEEETTSDNEESQQVTGGEGTTELTPEEQENINHKVKVVKQTEKVQYFKDAVHFIELMNVCIPVAIQLLGSKVSSDISESLELLSTAQEFGLEGAKEGVRKSLLLMASSEPSVHEQVMAMYIRLYFTQSSSCSAQKLLSLVRDADIGELASLEEMLCSLMKAKKLPKGLIGEFWSIIGSNEAAVVPGYREYSLMIISMIVKSLEDNSNQNMSLFLEHGLKGNNLIMAQYSCRAVHGLLSHKLSARLPSSHHLFTSLSDIMLSTVASERTSNWTPFAQQAVSVIYKLADQPNLIMEGIITKIHEKLCHYNGSHSTYILLLLRLIALAGEMALQALVFLEGDVKKELLKRKSNNNGEENEQPKSKEDQAIEDELGLGLPNDEVEVEAIRQLCIREVCGSGILGCILPLIVSVVSHPKRYCSDQLQISASLALNKYMITSPRVCEQYLRLFFTLMESSPLPTVRSNALIALADLIVRFPNLIEPWTKNVYNRLCDSDPDVRQSAVTVLTHLILNDMIKVKGQLSEMVLCLEDPVQKIASKVKLFFSELSKKANSLYNILPDIISRLSDPSNSITSEKFRNMMSYIISLIHKDKQSEKLVEKFCHRFRATRGELQSQNLAFCLAQLNYSERGLRKLQENFACYQSFLTDEDVYASFTAIVAKVKMFQKSEVKLLVEEFESKLKATHEKGKQRSDPSPDTAHTDDTAKDNTWSTFGTPRDPPQDYSRDAVTSTRRSQVTFQQESTNLHTP